MTVRGRPPARRISDGIQQGVMDMRMVPIGPLFTRFKHVVRDITRTNGGRSAS